MRTRSNSPICQNRGSSSELEVFLGLFGGRKRTPNVKILHRHLPGPFLRTPAVQRRGRKLVRSIYSAGLDTGARLGDEKKKLQLVAAEASDSSQRGWLLEI